jgi:hypothetical protein
MSEDKARLPDVLRHSWVASEAEKASMLAHSAMETPHERHA